jgi:8-oxo-dGTP pyrophosphatase MutT (NUDIX family)
MQIDKQIVLRAMAQPGFENWRPNFEARHLNRPARRPAELDGKGRMGAVLLITFCDPRDEPPQTRLILTRRNEELNNHAGQISLPGGQQDKNESLEQTALREAKEEIGLESNEIEIVGQLNQVYIPPSDFTVVPFVGWCHKIPKWVRSEYEVAEIIEASVDDLLKPTSLTQGPVQIDNVQRRVAYYQVGQHRVWGATAIILNEFLLRIQAVIGTNFPS